jgi:hypothetical protein
MSTFSQVLGEIDIDDNYSSAQYYTFGKAID